MLSGDLQILLTWLRGYGATADAETIRNRVDAIVSRGAEQAACMERRLQPQIAKGVVESPEVTILDTWRTRRAGRGGEVPLGPGPGTAA